MSEDSKFDVRNFSGVIREIMIFRINQLGRVNTANHFWKAQQDVTKLRAKLERAYNGQVQRAKSLDDVVELWMFGLAAYILITEEGRRLDDVCQMSGPKWVAKAKELASDIIEEPQYFFDKKSAQGEVTDD